MTLRKKSLFWQRRRNCLDNFYNVLNIVINRKNTGELCVILLFDSLVRSSFCLRLKQVIFPSSVKKTSSNKKKKSKQKQSEKRAAGFIYASPYELPPGTPFSKVDTPTSVVDERLSEIYAPASLSFRISSASPALSTAQQAPPPPPLPERNSTFLSPAPLNNIVATPTSQPNSIQFREATPLSPQPSSLQQYKDTPAPTSQPTSLIFKEAAASQPNSLLNSRPATSATPQLNSLHGSNAPNSQPTSLVFNASAAGQNNLTKESALQILSGSRPTATEQSITSKETVMAPAIPPPPPLPPPPPAPSTANRPHTFLQVMKTHLGPTKSC